jgi:hypothetical protein
VGHAVAAVVPPEGLTDVHRYATLLIGGRRVIVDVTMPLDEWDGRSNTPLACGPGEDVLAGDDPTEAKAELEARFCDPAVREPFIAALSTLGNDD